MIIIYMAIWHLLVRSTPFKQTELSAEIFLFIFQIFKYNGPAKISTKRRLYIYILNRSNKYLMDVKT